MLSQARTTSHNWADQDEREFTQMLERELDKIHNFQKTKVRRVLHAVFSPIPTPVVQTFELSRRINDAEKAVKRLVASSEFTNGHNGHHQQESTGPADTEAQQRRESVTQDAGSDDDDDMGDDDDDALSVDALEDQFMLLEEEVATLVADVHDLALYTKLNITGFMKILKVRPIVPILPGPKLIRRSHDAPSRLEIET